MTDSANLGQATKADDGADRLGNPNERSPGPFPLKFPYALAAAAGSGVIYFVSYPGVGVWPLAFVALVPGLLALQGQRPGRAAVLGLAMGTGMTVPGFYWLQGMLQTFSGFPAALCGLFTLIVCAYQGGRLALMAWLYARASDRGWPRAPLFAAAFVASELAYPLLFPWYFGAAVWKQPIFTQVAEIGGPIAVGLVLVAANLAVHELAVARLERRPVSRPVVLSATGFVLLSALFGVIRIRAVDAKAAEAERVRVGVVQANMGLMQKREDAAEGLRRHLRMTRELKEKGVDLVVWSESSATFPMRETVYKEGMRNYVGRQLGVSAIVGGVLYNFDKAVNRDRFYNVAVSMDTTGEVLGRYDKEYLLAFGEYLPFGEMFPVLYEMSPNSGKFTPGTDLTPLPLRINGKEHTVTSLICYEDILPSFTNQAVRKGNPELLVNMTNDAWFGDTSEPWEHLALATFRSVEHRRYLVRSTNSGVSAIVDPVGRVIAQSGTFKTEALDAEIRFMRATTAYEILGDAPWMIIALGSLFCAVVRRRGSEVALSASA